MRSVRRRRLVGVAARIGAVLLSAALLTLSLPPVSVWPLVFVALAPLFVAWRAADSAAEAAALGLVWAGLVALATGSFLPPLVARFFDVSLAAGWLAFAALGVLAWGLHAAALGVLVRAVAGGAAASVPAVAAAFALHELARAHLPIANPWDAVAVAFAPGSVWLQLADVAGPSGPAFVVASASAGAAVAAGRLARRRDAASATLALGAAALVLAMAGAYGAIRLRLLRSDGAPRVHVAAAHLAHGPERARDPARDREAVDELVGLAARARTTPARLVVLPEHALPFPLADASAEARQVLGATEGSEADWLIGGRSLGFERSGLRMRNSVFLVRDGQLVGRYDKVSLLPFAERRPAAWLPLGTDRFDPGDAEPGRPLETRIGKVGALVCSEAMTPATARSSVAAGAVVLVNPSFDGWFATHGAREQQLRLVALRAIETRRAVLRATTRGRTAIIDPSGRVLDVRDGPEVGLVTAEIPLRDGATAYGRMGDGGVAVGLLAATALGVVPRARRLALRRISPREAPPRR